MKYKKRRQPAGRLCLAIILVGMWVAIGAGCASTDPRKVDVELEKSLPGAKVTSFSEALDNLGRMTVIFGAPELRVMSKPIGDTTGASGATGAEIPRDITEMVKSSLNKIGGRVTFVPYDPAFIQNQMVTGYSDFADKVIPDVVLHGGITEFDRGLETRGDGTDASAEYEFQNVPDGISGKVGFDYGDSGKAGLARIALDFTMFDFKTMAAIKKMTVSNKMEVHKAMANKELGVTLFGLSFGLEGSVKKVQGRHDAVRLLVELSMIQIVGRQLGLPYWKLLGDDAAEDPVVLENLARGFYGAGETQRVAAIQQLLYLHGHDLSINGKMDAATTGALQQACPGCSGPDLAAYRQLFVSMPVDQRTLARRYAMQGSTTKASAAVGRPVSRPAPAPAAPAAATKAPAPAPAPAASAAAAAQPQVSRAAAPASKAAPAPEPERKTSKRRKGSIGRMLTEDEW